MAHQLESRRPFPDSMIWDLQRQYFHARSILAWKQEEVPQYITTNPTVASSYAEIVFAFLRDDERLDGGGEPLYVCELGAGSGRFAFHFLSCLDALCEQHQVPLTRFRYVLTDFVEQNLEFYRAHPRFRTYFERGVLDTAAFDVVSSDTLTLQRSGLSIAAGTLARPLVVLANYVFDGVPQDSFHFHEGQCSRCLLSLEIEEDPATLDAPAILSRATYALEYEKVDGRVYEEPGLQRLVEDYRRDVTSGYVSFPLAGLRCVSRLRTFSPRGLLLLTADKGYHRVAEGSAEPRLGLARHGSVSMDVNYDAFARYAEHQGGMVLRPASDHQSLSVSALLMTDGAEACIETRRAYARHVEEFGPDDFYTLSRLVRRHIGDMSLAELLACVRLSHYDSTQFGRYLPRLMELAADLDEQGRRAVTGTIEKVWELYFPLGESNDLAFEIAHALYEMDDFSAAITFFERSIETYGDQTGTLCNIALCHRMLGDGAAAEAALRRALKIDPANREAMQLLAQLA